MSQSQKILKLLKDGRTITARIASKYGIDRCAARVCDLRAAGHNIKTLMVSRRGKRFASYRLY